MATSQPAAQATDRGPGLIAAPLIVIGGGDHARVVIEAARSQTDGWSIQGYVAPEASPIDSAVPHLGDDADLVRRLADLAPDEQPWLILGFGGGSNAEGLADRLRTVDRYGPTARWATVVHAAAWVSPSATVAPGVAIMALAVVNTGASIGAHAIVNSGAIVEHDVELGVGCHLGPGAAVGGGTRIGAGTFVGLRASIRDHIEIGAGALVGMGAVVVDSVAGGSRVLGIPARSGGTDPS